MERLYIARMTASELAEFAGISAERAAFAVEREALRARIAELMVECGGLRGELSRLESSPAVPPVCATPDVQNTIVAQLETNHSIELRSITDERDELRVTNTNLRASLTERETFYIEELRVLGELHRDEMRKIIEERDLLAANQMAAV